MRFLITNHRKKNLSDTTFEMKNMKKFSLSLLLFSCVTALWAQDKRNMFNPVYYSVTSQMIAPDARAAGMGDVGAATDPDVVSQYWNPAKYPFNISRSVSQLHPMATPVGQRHRPGLSCRLLSHRQLLGCVGFVALLFTGRSHDRARRRPFYDHQPV